MIDQVALASERVNTCRMVRTTLDAEATLMANRAKYAEKALAALPSGEARRRVQWYVHYCQTARMWAEYALQAAIHELIQAEVALQVAQKEVQGDRVTEPPADEGSDPAPGGPGGGPLPGEVGEAPGPGGGRG